MDALVNGAEAFIQVFRTAADVFVGFTTGIIPIVVVQEVFWEDSQVQVWIFLPTYGG